MLSVMRGAAVAGCLLLSLAACTTSPTTEKQTTTPPSPTPPAFRYRVSDLGAALPASYGKHRLDPTAYLFPVQDNWTPRRDPLAGHTVLPEVCRAIIWNGGNAGRPGDFIPPDTPSAGTSILLGSQIGEVAPVVAVSIVELTGALADKFMTERRPTPAECAHIRVDGRESASVVERALPGFGDQSRYTVRAFPVTGKPWTERFLTYRTSTYVAVIRFDGFTATEPAFMAFARATRDRITAQLKAATAGPK